MQFPTIERATSEGRLLVRQDSGSRCGSEGSMEDYNLGLHIFAVFLIMFCGTAACCLPTIVKAYPQLAISRRALFICRHFGTGVLIALAFAHLLPTAFESLWDECLSRFWTDEYDAMPGFIAMLSALAVMLVEMGFTLNGLRHVCSTGTPAERVERRPVNDNGDRRRLPVQAKHCKSAEAHSRRASKVGIDNRQSTVETAPSEGVTDVSIEDDVEQLLLKELSTKQLERRMILQCLLLEAGILFHSVFIGLSISLSTGTTFIALMIAIAFHQVFEGLALGARIAAIPRFKVSDTKPWLMAVAIIGLAVRDTYNPEGETGLLVVGIANAISAGMIIYAGLVQLLGEELLSEESYSKYALRSRMEAVVSLIFGALLMSMIAIWA